MTRACPVMRAFNTKGKIVNVYCGSWACEQCAKRIASQWAWRVRIHIQEREGKWYFWTLTLSSQYVTAAKGFAALPALWDNLRKTMQRKHPKWEYCAFVEGQPNRSYMPHFHVISSVKAHIRIKDLAVHVGFGYQAKEKLVDGPQAGAYVAKYATKQSPNTPKNFRRVRTSRGWSKLPILDGAQLIVKSRNEHEWQYLLRVHDITGIDMKKLQRLWELNGHLIDNEDE